MFHLDSLFELVPWNFELDSEIRQNLTRRLQDFSNIVENDALYLIRRTITPLLKGSMAAEKTKQIAPQYGRCCPIVLAVLKKIHRRVYTTKRVIKVWLFWLYSESVFGYYWITTIIAPTRINSS